MRLSTKNLGRRSMMLVALVFMTLSAVAADLNWTFTFAPADINLSASGQYTVITLADGSNPRDAVGVPPFRRSLRTSCCRAALPTSPSALPATWCCWHQTSRPGLRSA